MKMDSNMLLHTYQQMSFYPPVLKHVKITPVAVIWTAAELLSTISTTWYQHTHNEVRALLDAGIHAEILNQVAQLHTNTHTYLTILFNPSLHQITLKSGYNITIQYATLPTLHANYTQIPLNLNNAKTDNHKMQVPSLYSVYFVYTSWLCNKK